MKLSLSTYLLALTASAIVNTATAAETCLADCVQIDDVKTCTFDVKVNLNAGELGYFQIEQCGDEVNPTIGIEKGVTYNFVQGDETNYFHPLGFAYYPDGAHAGVDELEPGIVPPGSESDCADGQFLCPAPMYMKGGEYLGAYSNNEVITPAGTMSDENFGLDDYEPEFFLDPLTWNTAGEYSIALKFDVDDFTDDIFYFCHIHQFMTGRIKFVDSDGDFLSPDKFPVIEYTYDMPSEYDQECGTFGLGEFQLPHPECPEKFVCNKPGIETPVGKFADCLDSMNCAMAVGMTTNVNQNSAIALFIHQMIPHHQNAVNMCKALMKSGEVQCADIEDEEDPHCVMKLLCYAIINGQNFQIQTMRGVLESLEYPAEDDCKVLIPQKKKSKAANKKHSKRRV